MFIHIFDELYFDFCVETIAKAYGRSAFETLAELFPLGTVTSIKL
jgi:hypothetical protein